MSDFQTDFRIETAVERRSELRRKAFKGGVITFNRGYSAYECVVRNLSEHGARLVFGDMAAVPHAFELAIGAEAARKAQICWREGTAIGVAFA